MPRIEVQPELLSEGGTRQSAVAARLHDVAARLKSATSSAAAAAGDGGVAGAATAYGVVWSTGLDGVAESIGALGANLGAAASAYATTDSAVVRRGNP